MKQAMQFQLVEDPRELGRLAARQGAAVIRDAQRQRGHATIVVATGASQFATLEALVREPGIDWTRVTAFHLDEYVGLPESHPASFRRYLRERFLTPLAIPPEFVPVQGDAEDLPTELKRLNGLLADRQVDLCLAGIGENGHLAFNDPPADFDTSDPYILVQLDDACRRQQFDEGWFATLAAVPRQAISMSIRQIMRSACLVLSVPDQRKAAAVKRAVEGPVSPQCPASIVQRHPNCTLWVDTAAASTLAQWPGAKT